MSWAVVLGIWAFITFLIIGPKELRAAFGDNGETLTHAVQRWSKGHKMRAMAIFLFFWLGIAAVLTWHFWLSPWSSWQ